MEFAVKNINKIDNKRWFRLPVVTAIVLIMLCGVQVSAEEYLYSYKNDQGTVVIDDHVPPKYAKSGYKILNQMGKVVEIVPRQLSEDELQNLSSEEARERHRKQEEEKLRQWDESLLRRYSDVADIEAVRDRAIKELQIRLSILRGNVMATKSQVEVQQAEAADIERLGKNVPKKITGNIEQLKLEINLAEQAIKSREQEIDDVKASYVKDIDRFRYLIEVKGYRRR